MVSIVYHKTVFQKSLFFLLCWQNRWDFRRNYPEVQFVTLYSESAEKYSSIIANLPSLWEKSISSIILWSQILCENLIRYKTVDYFRRAATSYYYSEGISISRTPQKYRLSYWSSETPFSMDSQILCYPRKSIRLQYHRHALCYSPWCICRRSRNLSEILEDDWTNCLQNLS